MHTTKALICSLMLALPTLVSAAHADSSPAQATVTQAPIYPEPAIKRGIEGVVHLQLEISASGDVVSVQRAADAAHPLLYTAALESLQGWQFEPAKQAGEPVASSLIVPIRFQLDAAPQDRHSAVGPTSLKALW